ncbi:MAG: hypothetical protein ACKOXX_03470, partial [Actinomycetota bacterium]
FFNLALERGTATGEPREQSGPYSGSDLVDRALAAAERELSAVASREQVAMQRISVWEASVLASESRGGDITDVGALLALGEALHRR